MSSNSRAVNAVELSEPGLLQVDFLPQQLLRVVRLQVGVDLIERKMLMVNIVFVEPDRDSSAPENASKRKNEQAL